ncbi:hypothetical protein KKI23_01230, partial [Patescibacteria group bacterium]|nr:hypothetical protein [Patescibacteria group bacterium]
MAQIDPKNNMKKSQTTKGKSSTQAHLDISEIKDNCVVMKDGTLRQVLLVSSINFSLKSQEEQTAVIQAYTQFLNSMDFPLQIVIQSRRLNIDQYLQMLHDLEREQVNELLRMQTADYRKFVSELVELADIMSKRFFVVVPYSPLSNKQKSFVDRVRETLSPTSIIKLSQSKFNKYNTEILKRTNMIVSGLASMDLKAVVLDTQSLIELYYRSY